MIVVASKILMLRREKMPSLQHASLYIFDCYTHSATVCLCVSDFYWFMYIRFSDTYFVSVFTLIHTLLFRVPSHWFCVRDVILRQNPGEQRRPPCCECLSVHLPEKKLLWLSACAMPSMSLRTLCASYAARHPGVAMCLCFFRPWTGIIM